MSKLVTAALAALIGVAAISAPITTASADWKGPPHSYKHGHGGGWKPGPGVGFAAGAIVGLGVGALVAPPRPYYVPVQPYYPPAPVYYPPPPVVYPAPPPPAYYQVSSWQAHVDYCRARYRSYNVATDTFTGYDGYQHRCVSPY